MSQIRRRRMMQKIVGLWKIFLWKINMSNDHNERTISLVKVIKDKREFIYRVWGPPKSWYIKRYLKENFNSKFKEFNIIYAMPLHKCWHFCLSTHYFINHCIKLFMHTNCQLMKQSTIKNCRGSLSQNILKKTGPVLETINCCPVANQWKESKRKLKMMWIQRSGDNMTSWHHLLLLATF